MNARLPSKLILKSGTPPVKIVIAVFTTFIGVAALTIATLTGLILAGQFGIMPTTEMSSELVIYYTLATLAMVYLTIAVASLYLYVELFAYSGTQLLVAGLLFYGIILSGGSSRSFVSWLVCSGAVMSCLIGAGVGYSIAHRWQGLRWQRIWRCKKTSRIFHVSVATTRFLMLAALMLLFPLAAELVLSLSTNCIEQLTSM